MAERSSATANGRELIPVKQSGKHLTVDIHAHLNVAAAAQLIRVAVPDAPNPLSFSCPATANNVGSRQPQFFSDGELSALVARTLSGMKVPS